MEKCLTYFTRDICTTMCLFAAIFESLFKSIKGVHIVVMPYPGILA